MVSFRWVSPLFAATPPLAPEYVRIPNVFTSALNTRLNTRIYLPTPAYCPRRLPPAATSHPPCTATSTPFRSTQSPPPASPHRNARSFPRRFPSPSRNESDKTRNFPPRVAVVLRPPRCGSSRRRIKLSHDRRFTAGARVGRSGCGTRIGRWQAPQQVGC